MSVHCTAPDLIHCMVPDHIHCTVPDHIHYIVPNAPLHIASGTHAELTFCTNHKSFCAKLYPGVLVHVYTVGPH